MEPRLQRALNASRALSDMNLKNDIAVKRAQMFKDALKAQGQKANVGVALRALLLADQDLFRDVATIEGGHLLDVFNRLSAAGTFRAIDADSGAGDNDLGGLFVETAIRKRVEADSELLSIATIKRGVSKSYKFPKNSQIAKAAFADVSDDLTDLTTTIDNGFDNVAMESQKFGGILFLEAEVYAKFDAEVVSQIIGLLSDAYRRGMHDQIVNGAGTGVTATGLATNATSITWDTNVSTTLVKMAASVADASKGGMGGLFMLTNTAGAMKFGAEQATNLSLYSMVGADGFRFGGVNLPLIVDDMSVVTSGSSPNKAAALYVGRKGDYLIAINKEPQIEIDVYGDFAAGGEKVRIMSFWTGKPAWNDSFAKTTIPTIY